MRRLRDFLRWLKRLPLQWWGILGAVVLVSTAGVVTYTMTSQPAESANRNPLQSKRLYRDTDRPIVELTNSLRAQGRTDDANQLSKIVTQPNTTWLTGPSTDDPTAQRDIDRVARTSTEAAAEQVVPVYSIYAIPQRDACAGYSAAGFQTDEDYLAWIDRVVGAMRSQAIFSVEADAVAHTVRDSCLSQAQVADRYALISQAIAKLRAAPLGAVIYIDAGHPEWFPDPSVLVKPLKAAGINQARGVAVNVSFYESTDKTVRWAQKLTALLGENKGAIIDTSRNGNGAPASDVTGEARWCNPAGRSLGHVPTTATGQATIDAFVWIKNPGESDGSCFGNPPAGVLSESLALELARNATD